MQERVTGPKRKIVLALVVVAVGAFLIFKPFSPKTSPKISNDQSKEGATKSNSKPDLREISLDSKTATTFNGNVDISFLEKDVSFAYEVLEFSGELSKSTARFIFYTQDDKVYASLVYILSGTADHGMYQNGIVDGITYATNVLNSKSDKGKEDVKINLLDDYNSSADSLLGRIIKPNEISRITVQLDAISPDQDHVVAVKYRGIEKILSN